MEVIKALLIGGAFGYVLQRVGASDPDKIINMLRLRDFHLMKVILTAIGFSSAILFSSLMLGVIDSGHLSIKAMNFGVVLGGALLGIGWAIAGYCPGTGVVAAGSGRKDALFFIAGGLLGAWLFVLTFKFFDKTWILENLLGGKATLVFTSQSTALIGASWSVVIAIGLAVLMVIIAKFLPKKEG